MSTKLPTLRELYGDEVCDAVLQLPFDDQFYYMVVRVDGSFDFRCCVVGALNVVAWKQAHPDKAGLPGLRRRPSSADVEQDYQTATGHKLSPEGYETTLRAYSDYDLATLGVGGGRKAVVKRLLKRGEKS